MHNLLDARASADGRWPEAAWSASQELTQWYMRTGERALSGTFLHPERGLVEARDSWR